MYYTLDNGSRVYYCGGEQQKRMCKNGWRLMLGEPYNEDANHMYNRLSKEYKQVKIYYDTTMVRGLHEYFAFVKDKIKKEIVL